MSEEIAVQREGGARVPFVGRLAEREAIIAAMRRASTEGRPQLVTVLGPPGVGKSRLVSEALADLAARVPEARSLRGACTEASGLQPALARILRSRLGLVDSADAVTQAMEMRAKVTELFGDRRVSEILHFLGAFLGLRFGGTPFADAFEDDARAQREVSRAVLRRFFEVDAQRAPLLLAVDDLQFATDDGVRLLRDFVEGIPRAPLVLVVTASPEFLAAQPTWTTALGERHERLDLAPLSASEAGVLVRALLAKLPRPPAELVRVAVEMGGGNPSLLERVVQVFYDRGVIVTGDKGSWSVDLEKLETITVSLGVEDAVRWRLASLSPAEREVLEFGAVMGSVFWLGGLVVLGRARREVPELWGGTEDLAPHYRDLLARLEERDFVLKMPDSSLADDEEWIFKHRLERESLAALVSERDRREWHLLLAEWLEFRLRDRNEEQLDLLAHHYERGERPLRAARCLLESAETARARYANTKAVAHYERGLELLGEHDVRLRLDAHHALGDVLQLLGRTEDAEAQFRHMLAWAYRLDQRGKGGAAHNRLGRLYRETGHLERAMRHLGTGLALFEAGGDERGVASSLDDIGKTHWLRGSYDQALRYLHDALARRERFGEARSIALSLNNLGLVLQDSGQYRAALEAFRRALELRRSVDDLPGVTATLNNLGTVFQDQGEHERAVGLWREALAVAREVGDRKRQALLLINLGQGMYRLGKPEEALPLLEQAEQMALELGDRILVAEAWRGIGKALLLQGKRDEARTQLERSVELFAQARSRVHEGVARRSLGECLASEGYDSDDGRAAEKQYRRALEIFSESRSELEYARTARMLAAHIARAPQTADFEYLRAQAAELERRADEMFEKLRRAVELDGPAALADGAAAGPSAARPASRPPGPASDVWDAATGSLRVGGPAPAPVLPEEPS